MTPPPVLLNLEESMTAYWKRRAEQHTADSYRGVPMSKFPEDLRVYEHLLFQGAYDTVLELGCQYGGSALWFRDRLRSFGAYGDPPTPIRVVTLDINPGLAETHLNAADRRWRDTITLVAGSVTDANVAKEIHSLVAGRRVFVVEDSAHVFDTTYAALRLYHDLVPLNGYFVVEDGSVDEEALRLDFWPRGVQPAIRKFLSDGHPFRIRKDMEMYGPTSHCNGYLERIG